MRKLLVMVVLVVGMMVSVAFGQNAGVVWTEVKNSPFKGGSINSIVWGKDKFVAVGGTSEYVGSTLVRRTSTIAYSSDGVTWTAVKNIPFDRVIVSNIYWYNDCFIAWGRDYSSQNHNRVSAYSCDGITWTSANNYLPFYNIAYGNNMFVAVGDFVEGTTYSSDGITWVSENEFQENGGGCGSGVGGESNVVWGNGMFIKVMYRMACDGANEVSSAHSSDGINWTWMEIGETFYNVVWGNDKFVATSDHPSRITYSSNGITWTEVNNKILDKYQVGSITWGNNRFIVHTYSCNYVGDDDYSYCDPINSNFAYSSDGINWSLAKNYPFGKNGSSKIVYGNGVFVAGSGDRLAYSK
jgi:hypothetical protein